MEEPKRIEIRDKGFTRVKVVEEAKLQDSSWSDYKKFRDDTLDKLTKLTNDIHGIKMQLGRLSKYKGKDLNILEGGEK